MIAALLLFCALLLNNAAATVYRVPCLGGADITTTLQAAINGTIDNDTVIIGAGSCIMSNLTINDRNIIVKGSGQGVTNITAQSGFGTWITNGSNNTTWRLSGISLSGTAAINPLIVWANQAAFWHGPLRVDHMDFNYPNGGNNIQFFGPLYGVVDHNHFEGAFENALIFGLWLASEDGVTTMPNIRGSWAAGQAYLPGTANNGNYFYIEDNVFTGTGGSGIAAVDSDYSGMRIVLRHNIMNNSALFSHWSTDHNINSLWWEIYNNVFTWNTAVAPSVPYFARLQGGGTGIFYNNTVNGFGANNIIVLGEARTVAEGQSGPPINFCDGTNTWDGNAGDTNAPGWPCIVQTGRNADKTVASIIAGSKESSFPMYFWNNGPQDKCYNSAAAGAACDNSVVPSIRDPNWFKATAHTVTGGGYGQGDVDYSVTASQPSGAGTHTLTYTPYVYPHPLNIPDVVVAQAQPQQTPDTLWGSIYNAIVPTYSDRQTPVWQGDVNGRLRMQGLTVGPAQFLLQAPGAGNILQTNGVAKICLAGTC